MHYYEDPPAIHCYSRTFLPLTRQLLSSRDELARVVQTNSSPLGRFLSLSGLASSQPKLTEWTEERLRSLLDRAQRVRVPRNDLTKEFLGYRGNPHYEKDLDDLGRWREFKKNRQHRHYWSQALCCNYDWESDLSRSLKRLFGRSEQTLIRVSEIQDNGRVERAFEDRVLEVVTFEYRTASGEVRHKTLHANRSTDGVTTRDHAQDDSTQLPSALKEPVASSSSSESRPEYENVLEYREINRHARRKIEAWLNDGWSVEWKWNGMYDGFRCVNKRREYGFRFRSAHWMVLKRSRANVCPSASNKRIVLEFPTTPERPR